MKALKIIISALILLVLIVMGAMWWMGFFTNVTLVEKEAGGYQLAGLDFVGEYSKVGSTMNTVDSTLRSMGVNSTKGFGIYYDNPQTTPKEKCRSFVGNVLEVNDSALLDSIARKGLKIQSIPVKPSVVCEFPIKNKMSYMVGPIKVYPIFSKYLIEKGFKPSLSMEIYDIPKNKTDFIMQLEK